VEINDSSAFFIIRTDSKDGIPVLEQEISTGNYNVLVFTSEETAKQYCYQRCPGLTENVLRLDKKFVGNDMQQIGLIRLARHVGINYKSITGFIFDHPGMPGATVEYATVEAVAHLLSNLTKETEPKKYANELLSYLEGNESKDGVE
jgi:hypothetical protein